MLCFMVLSFWILDRECSKCSVNILILPLGWRYITLTICFSPISFTISTYKSSTLFFDEYGIFNSGFSQTLYVFLMNIATPPTFESTGSAKNGI